MDGGIKYQCTRVRLAICGSTRTTDPNDAVIDFI